jgi:hypothetical protein
MSDFDFSSRRLHSNVKIDGEYDIIVCGQAPLVLLWPADWPKIPPFGCC